MANIIEVLLRMKSDTSGLTKFKQQIGGLKQLVGGLAVGAGLTALVRNIEEAEKATAQLDAAFKNTGATVGLTRARLDGLASSLQSTTKFGDDLVKEGESILLTFDKVRGQAFERTIKVAADLSSRLGTDLKTSIRQVGLALQDPTNGLQLLRRAGISFDETQKGLIENFVKTNDLAKAQNVVLTELERRFKGSAIAARSTLGGALAGLKNAFGDLFEGSRESTRQAADAVNELTKALEDPRVKKGLDRLIEGFSKIAADAIRAAAALPEKLGIVDTNAYSRGGGPRRGSVSAGAPEPNAAVVQLEEIRITVRKLVDENGDLMREFQEATKTATQKAAGDYIRFKETLDFLFSQGALGQGQAGKDEFNKRLGAQLDELLPEFDLNEIRSKYISLKKETTELGEFMKGVWQGVGRSIQSTISDAIYEWKLSWGSLINIARRALADIASAILTSGIKKALKDQTAASGGANFFGALFAAGSGSGDQSELADSFFAFKKQGSTAGASKYSPASKMSFGGGNITFAPVTKVQIIQSDNPERMKQEIFQEVAIVNAKQQQEFVRVLQLSGLEVKG